MTPGLLAALAGWAGTLRRDVGHPVAIGIAGAQGSGKSTLAQALAALLEAEGLSTALLSIDDLYLPRGERMALAERVHPLFAARGPPGTHDVRLGLELMERLTSGSGLIALPRFDKARDDRATHGVEVRAPVDVVLLEGWLVGARPQGEDALRRPVNGLERQEDAQGRWRRYADGALGGDYLRLWARLDRLVFLQASGFEPVARWRLQQEESLTGAPSPMDAAAVARFVAHYERLTRWMIEDLPGRADVVIGLDAERRVTSVRGLDPD